MKEIQRRIKRTYIVMDLKDEIRKFSMSSGIDLFGVAPIEVYSEYLEEISNRIKENQNQLQDFMVNESDTDFFRRLSNPHELLPSAQAIIILGIYSYDEHSDYKSAQKELRCKTARTYSYYPVVRDATQKVADYIREQGYEAVEGQNIPLKHAADRIGLGSYGKNGLLYTRRYGSFIALRNIITNAPLTPDCFQKEDVCTGCDACLKACPTKALYAPYKVNPRLCINPVGRRDDRIPEDMRKKMRNWLRGCDICQEVCPANKQLEARSADLRAGFDSKRHDSHKDLDGLEKCPEILELLKEEYPHTIRRNAVISLANICQYNEAVVRQIQGYADGMDDEVLKEYYIWAIDELNRKSSSGKTLNHAE